MILPLTFALPLVAAVACLALNQLVETRALGVIAGLVLVICAGMLVVARSNNTLTLVERLWLQIDNQTIMLALGYDAASLVFAVLVAAGGGLALLALALALPAKLRGYGGLVATLLFLFETTLLGLAARETLLLPIAWAALPLLGFIALRASGGQNEAQTLPVGLLGNLLGAVVLLGALLSARFAGVGTSVPDVALLGMLVAALLAIGLPPFHRMVNDITFAPANVAAPLLAFGMPLLGGYTLLRFVPQSALTDNWRSALQIIGLATVAICGAAALRERRLRTLVGWMMSAQFGFLLISLGLSQTVLATIAPALLLNTMLVTLISLLACALIERRAGTDHLDEINLTAPLLVPGVAFAIAAASSLGVPGTWGFIPIRWLYDELAVNAPLLLGPLLASMALLGLAWLAPVVAFLRVPGASTPAKFGSNMLALVGPLVAAIPLVAFGLAPSVAWGNWGEAARLALVPLAPTNLAAPSLPSTLSTVVGAGVLMLALGFALGMRTRSERRSMPDPEIAASGVMTPDALGESLSWLSWFGAPSSTFAQLWEWLGALSRRLNWALSFLEQRYFMAGLMIAVVAVILLLMQG